mmetsp:Transcript_5007/g.10546  ORF Transcript_5007/g.10546 Transcript_5007/m.10546 type:complete len:158 (-) Transcript_5007:1066-1539(-)
MQEANLTQPLPLSKMGGDADNTTAASAYPGGGGRGGNNSLIHLFHLGYRSLVAQLGDLFSNEETSNSSSNGHDDHNKEVMRCYCLPCLKFGHGERGKSNVKTIFGLIFVPFFLLTFFLLDDFGKVVVRNMQLRQGPSGLMSNRDETGVIDFHLNRRH